MIKFISTLLAKWEWSYLRLKIFKKIDSFKYNKVRKDWRPVANDGSKNIQERWYKKNMVFKPTTFGRRGHF